MIRTCFLWVGILLVAYPILGQTEYVFQHIDQEDGLSTTTVDFFHRSTEGHLYFATISGLNKYDGQTIEVFREQANPGFIGTDIQSSFFESSDGKIWFTTGKAIVAYDQICGTFKSFILGETESGSPHYAFYLEQDRFLWTTASQKLYRFDTDSISHPAYQAELIVDSTDLKRAVVKTDQNGQVEAIYGVFKLRHFTGIHYLQLKNGLVTQDTVIQPQWAEQENKRFNFTDISITTNGTLYLLTSTALIQLDGEQPGLVQQLIPFPENSRVRDFQLVGQDEIWILTSSQGILTYNFSTGSWEGQALAAWDYAQNRYLLGGDKFFLDSDSTLWICRNEEGLYVSHLRPSDTRSLYRINNLPAEAVGRLIVEPNGNVWSVRGTKALHFSPTGQLLGQIRVPQKLKPLLRHGQNQYVMSVEGLSTIGPSFSQFSWVDSPVADITYFDHCQIDEESYLVATFSGIYYWNVKTEEFYQIRQDHEPGVVVGLEIINDRLWISSGSSKVIVVPFDRSHPDALGAADTSFQSLGIFNDHFYDAQQNVYWIGGPNGLYAFDPDNLSYRLYTIVDGLPSQDIKGVLPGMEGELWLSSSYGIFLARFSEEGDFIKTKHFTLRNGLSSNEFRRGAALKHPNGSLWFGSTQGLDVLHPGNISENSSAPSIYLAELLIHDQPWSSGKNIHHTPAIKLNYTENSLQFRLAALDYNDPSRTMFRVFIQQDGGPIQTIDLKNKHIVPFPNLAAGNYRFGFTAQSAQGVWAPEPHWLDIRITPPLWKRGWFRLLLSLVILGFTVTYLSAFYRARNAENQRLADLRAARLQNKIDLEEQRRLITSRIHNEMGGQLTTLNMLSSRIKNAVSLDKAQELNERINQRVRETRRRFSSFLRAVNPNFDELQKSMQLVKSESAGFLQDSGLQSSFDWPSTYPEQRLPPDFRLKLFELIQEVLNNIAKSADAQSVALQLRIPEDKKLELTILDDGSGFVPTAADFEKGIGLGSLQQISKELNGQLTYELRKTKGTKTQISLPLPTTD